ncbi:uncharacterized protein MONOS_13619 [Monocercomonoides exilis]|uniref:uncharacterized protein n=1 Tax=Monocercomonoides exilis TaxID=2049356 RepID=UPI00355A5870|nr:hypothetical protein MONOS_13619 [Monocercomonoides exilis]|eukprot:MONOS_13619.1-p1 / transcript=MONOS_13619.1 / gene=MONOS_13619 / organism=Monocercomonoides_exilis_PA203 / gene_product=unspecified product / transcript_product=unspecified product / location=Mono_scaffold00854:24422-25221(-) / protein_length=213 / sequence_SO=supercontig / SO=protein_coding / is_pseudo=false
MREREKEKWKEKLKEREKEKEKREKFPDLKLLGDWVELLDTDEAVDERGVNPLTLENYSSSNTINTFGFPDCATFLVDDFLFEQVLNNGDGILRRRFGTGTSPSSTQNESFLSLCQLSPSFSPSSSSSSSSSSPSSPAVTDLSLHIEPPNRSKIEMARRKRAMHPLLLRRCLNRCAQVAGASGASRSSSSSSSSFSFLLLLLRCCAFLETDF